MSEQKIIPPSPPRQWQQYLKRLESRTKTRKLLHVLDSFPLSSSLDFYETTLQGNKAIRVFLGHRKQSNGVVSKIWAYIVSGDSGMVPSVVFRDEESRTSGETQLYPRAASSLLRRAMDLHSPFCFLHFDSGDSPTNVRGMLCALVAYYALSAGFHDCALNWENFEVSLFQALQYIASRVEYQRRQPHHVDQSASILGDQAALAEETFQSSAEDAGASSAEDEVTHERKGGAVRSLGSSIKAKAGTTLAHLKKELGARVRLLDRIPDTPITISRQSRYPSYFPFRLHFGTYRPADLRRSPLIDVYVYFTHNGRNDVHIIGHGANGKEWSWKFDTLRDIQPFAPFAPFMRPTDLDIKTQGNKIRTLVYYYFMLAENEGLIDDPRIRVNTGMLGSFASACKTLQKEGRGSPQSARPAPGRNTDNVVQDSSEDTYSEQTNQDSESHEKKRSLVVKLKLNGKLLAEITGSPIPSQRIEVPDSESDEEIMQLDDTNEPATLPTQEAHIAHSLEADVSSRPKPGDSIHAVIVLSSSPGNLGQEVILGGPSRDSGFMSSSASPLMLPSSELNGTSPDLDPMVLDEKEDKSSAPDQTLNIGMGQTGQEYSGQNLPQPSKNQVPMTLFDRDSPASVISISSSSVIEDGDVNMPLFHIGLPPAISAPMAEPPTLPSQHNSIVNLCSDEEDSVPLRSLKPELEKTSEPLPVAYSSRTSIDQTSDRPDDAPSRDHKRNLDNIYDIYGSDIEEVEADILGDSWSRSQAKRRRTTID